MGYDQAAYLNIDQDEVTRFIAENGLDPTNWNDMERIGAEFGDKSLQGSGVSKKLGWMYEFNESCDMHEIWCLHCSSFIRDDDRFTNRRFQTMLCKRLGKDEDAFPSCLENICWSLKTREDAIEIAQALGEFFADDEHLTGFAGWLRDTATCCNTYELSY